MPNAVVLELGLEGVVGLAGGLSTFGCFDGLMLGDLLGLASGLSVAFGFSVALGLADLVLGLEVGPTVGRFDGEPVTIPGGVVTPYRLVDQYRMAVESDGALDGGDFVVTRVVGKTFEQAFLTRGGDGGSHLLPL